MLDHTRTAVEVIPGARRPDLVDQSSSVTGEVGAAVEVEDDHRPFGRDEGVAAGLCRHQTCMLALSVA